ncbi:hypothetical protein niasHT_023489 [Heterodera trifolii]|uniref:Uncharacterized protein n=2 Tax=Heterodera TaxID=34509 RepID=A0ABD2JJ62_9BILA
MRQKSSKAAICSIPAYCLRGIGCRHILIGGGGGSAKTGVPNQIQLFLLGYDSNFDLQKGIYESSNQMVARLSDVVDTGQSASMNMDCISLSDEPYYGRFLIVAGQDEFCALYETKHFSLSEMDGVVNFDRRFDAPSNLSFHVQELVRIQTDKHPGDDSYQKCVRLFRAGLDCNSPLKMATAGTDAFVRVWSIANVLRNVRTKNSFDRALFESGSVPVLRDVTPELEICTKSTSVDDLDVSPSGDVLATVLPDQTVLWDLSAFGKRLAEIPTRENGSEKALSNKFKVRSLRFANLSKNGTEINFVTAHNQRIRTSNEISFLCLWLFERQKGNCRMVGTKVAFKETVSCLELSECGRFSAVGSMGGSVALFDTLSLSPLSVLRQTHCSFVTALSFLPQRSCDVKDLGHIGETISHNLPSKRCFLPGICADFRCALVSVSVDRTIQVHQFPFPTQSSFSAFLFRLSILTSVLYMLRRVDINVANNTPIAHGVGKGRTPKIFGGTAGQLKNLGRKPKEDGGEKMKQEKGTTERTNLNGSKTKGAKMADELMKVMGDRDAEMRFTYLPLKDKYDGTFARELQLGEFVVLEDDCPKTEPSLAHQIDVFCDF